MGALLTMPRALWPDASSGFLEAVGIGGIGTGIAFQLEGDHTLGREESRLGALQSGRDYCKLHIVEHYIATLMGSKWPASPFRVSAIGVIGGDAAGQQVMDEMQSAGIDAGWVRTDAGRPTLFSACFIYPDRMGGNITASNSAAAQLSEADLRRGASRMQELAGKCIALCLPEVPLETRRSFLHLATECGNFRAASFTLSEVPQAIALDLFSMIDLVALNQEEAAALTGYAYVPEDTGRFLNRCSDALTRMHAGIGIVISAGAEGAYGFEDGHWSRCAAPKVSAISTGGAGDALLAGVLSGLAAGLSLACTAAPPCAEDEIDSALSLGVLLASLSVTSQDAIDFQADVEELERFATASGLRLGPRLHRAIRPM